MSMWREVNIFRGAHRLVPVLGRSTRTMPSLAIGWVRGDVRIRRDTQKLEKGEVLGRFLALAFIGYLLVYLCVPRPWTWWLWAAAWFLGCCVIAAAHGDVVSEPAQDADETGEPDTAAGNDHETAGDQPPSSGREKFLRHLEQLTRGRAGIHLGELHQHLTEQPPAAHLKKSDVRALLTHYGIPLKRTLRVDGVAGRSGVSREAVLELMQAVGLSPAPPPESSASPDSVSAPDLQGSP